MKWVGEEIKKKDKRSEREIDGLMGDEIRGNGGEGN